MSTQADDHSRVARESASPESSEHLFSDRCDATSVCRVARAGSIHSGELIHSSAIARQVLGLIDLLLLFSIALVLRADASTLTRSASAMLGRAAAAVSASAPRLSAGIVAAQGALAIIPLALASLIVIALSACLACMRDPFPIINFGWRHLRRYSLRPRDGAAIQRTPQP